MLKFELSQEMVQVVARALGEMPAKISMPVIQEMQRQISAQKNPSEQDAPK